MIIIQEKKKKKVTKTNIYQVKLKNTKIAMTTEIKLVKRVIKAVIMMVINDRTEVTIKVVKNIAMKSITKIVKIPLMKINLQVAKIRKKNTKGKKKIKNITVKIINIAKKIQVKNLLTKRDIKVVKKALLKVTRVKFMKVVQKVLVKNIQVNTNTKVVKKVPAKNIQVNTNTKVVKKILAKNIQMNISKKEVKVVVIEVTM